MKKWLLVCSLLILTAFLVYARHIKLTKQNNIKRHMTYTLGQEPLGCKKTFPSLTPGILYTIKASIWDSIGTNVYAVIVMNEDESAQLVSSSVKRGTHQVTFKMPEGTKDVHFYINATNSTTAPGPAHNFYIDDVQMTYPGMVTVQEPIDDYRFGFNGFEKDHEFRGLFNDYSFGDYGYDPRLGRRSNVDPKTAQYPGQSPYSAFNNNPVFYIDPTGQSGVAYKTNETNKDGKPILKVVSNIYIYGEGATEANAQLIQTNAMAQWNNNGNYFSAMVDGIEYEVHFEINVAVIDAKDVEAKLLEGKDYYHLNAENNYYEVMKDFPDAGYTIAAEGTGGNTGVLNTNKIGTPSPSHEMNHGYNGIDKDIKDKGETILEDNDIAVQGKNSKAPNERRVTQENINAIFEKVSFEGGNKVNIGIARPFLFDKNTQSLSRPVLPKK